jgi:hypothetical protein
MKFGKFHTHARLLIVWKFRHNRYNVRHNLLMGVNEIFPAFPPFTRWFGQYPVHQIFVSFFFFVKFGQVKGIFYLGRKWNFDHLFCIPRPI